MKCQPSVRLDLRPQRRPCDSRQAFTTTPTTTKMPGGMLPRNQMWFPYPGRDEL